MAFMGSRRAYLVSAAPSPLLNLNFGLQSYFYNGVTYATAAALFAAVGSITGGVAGATVTRGDGTVAKFAAANTPRISAPSSVTNLILNSATFGTQTIAVTSGITYTLSGYGTAAGVLTCSGASTATLTGTGVANRVSTTFTATTGSLTITLTSGTWTSSQLDVSPVLRAYTATTGTISTVDDYTAVRGNLALYSVPTSGLWGINASTVIFNNATAPDGSTTAAYVLPTAKYGSIQVGNATIPIVIGQTYCYSIWVLAGTVAHNLTIQVSDGVSYYAVTPTPTGIWTRYSVTFTSKSTSCVLTAQDNNTSGFGSFYVWGAQLEPVLYNNTTLTYPTARIPTSGSAVYVYDTPISGAGLLVEQASTNLLLQSNAFTTTWTNTSGPTPVAAAQMSPDQTVDAWSWTRTATTAQYNYQGVTSGASLAYTGSIIAKAGTGRYLALRLGSAAAPSASNNVQAIFDLFTGTVSTAASNISWTLPSATITALTNGFYRCTLTGTCDTNANPSMYYSFSSVSQQVDGATGVIGDSGYVYGAQLEQSVVPTSYITTGASPVTRAIDVPFINGNLLGSGNWAWLMDVVGVAVKPSGGPYGSLGTHSNGTTSNRLLFYDTPGGNALNLIETAGGSPTFSNFVGSNSIATGAARAAAMFNGSGVYAAANGSAVVLQGAWTPPAGLSVFGLGIGASLGSNPLNGYIRRAQVYRGGRYAQSWLQNLAA